MRQPRTRRVDQTAQSGRLRCNAQVHFCEADNQIAAPDWTDLNLHRSPMWVTQSAHGSLADDRPFLPRSRHVGLDRSKLLMEGVAAGVLRAAAERPHR